MNNLLSAVASVAVCLVTYPSHTFSSTQQQDPAMPVQVSAIQLDHSGRVVSFDLLNTATKTVTAWDVRVVVNGRITGESVDSYRSFAGLVPSRSYILPGGRLPVTLRQPSDPSSTSLSPSVTVTGAVFEDKSFVGNAEWVEFVFRSRAEEMTAWIQVVQEFEKLRVLPVLSLSALAASRSRFDDHNDAGDGVRNATRSNLALVMRDVSAAHEAQALSRLETLVQMARDSRIAAAAHSR
jgi:hypothetical protein